MANCDSKLKEFHSKISMSKSKKMQLTGNRNAIRNKIKDYFKNELQVKIPKFWHQGSFALRTQITPIDDEYDIDDGVYLQHFTNHSLSSLPAPQQISSHIKKALLKHTGEEPQIKKNCVRVTYAGNYHVDLPVYVEIDGTYYHGKNGKGTWEASDAKELGDWFNNKISRHGEQLRRNVKYLKGWSDYKGLNYLEGIMITVLVGRCHQSNANDDNSLINTVYKMINYLKDKKSLYKPVVPKSENLLENTNKLNTLIDDLTNLYNKGVKALDEADLTKSANIWIGLLGDRFPSIKDNNKKENKVNIKNPTKSWAN